MNVLITNSRRPLLPNKPGHIPGGYSVPITKREIDIRPASSVYATYQRLSYKPWYALAEFVDNSTASYLAHRDELLNIYKDEQPPRCRVDINYDPSARRLVIRDNAYGMELSDFERALVLDQPPTDRSGRNEFGMGLKTAACWFGTRWTVETTQLGSPRKYRATIDVGDLAQTRREAISYSVEEVPVSTHGTLVIIEDVQQPIVGRAHERVREQLRSLYRNDLRSGEVEIWYQGERLSFEDPELLTETVEDELKTWRQQIDMEVPWRRVGRALAVTGWIGIRKIMSRTHSGLVLMRRGRVIIGGPGHGYRPPGLCGSPQTHEYGRIVGELHLDDWPVNQAKDGFNWNDGLEDDFIEELAKVAKDIVRKARTHRLNPSKPGGISPTYIEAAAEPIRQVVQVDTFRRFVEAELHPQLSEPVGSYSSTNNPTPVSPAPTRSESNDTAVQLKQGHIEYSIDLDQGQWLLVLNWREDQPDEYWMSLTFPRPARDAEPRGAQVVEITLNMTHPFIAPYLHSQASLDVLQRLVFGLALAETLVRSQAGNGRVDPGVIRLKMNDVLKYAALAEREC